jgi:hypothetical protein
MAAALANRNTELMENSYFRLFTANGKRKRQISVCLPQTETEKRKFGFIGRQTINGNGQFFFQQHDHL